MEKRFERFSSAIMETFRCWQKIAGDEMEKYGLKGAHSIYLLALDKAEDGLTASQLCECCGKDKGDVSRALSLMKKQGFVAKVGGTNSSYRVKVVLTEQGKQVASFVRERSKLAVSMVGGNIPSDDLEIFYKTMGIIRDNLAQISKNGLPE